MGGYRELYIGAYETYKGLYEFNRGNTEYFDEGDNYNCTIGAAGKLLMGAYNCSRETVKTNEQFKPIEILDAIVRVDLK